MGKISLKKEPKAKKLKPKPKIKPTLEQRQNQRIVVNIGTNVLKPTRRKRTGSIRNKVIEKPQTQTPIYIPQSLPVTMQQPKESMNELINYLKQAEQHREAIKEKDVKKTNELEKEKKEEKRSEVLTKEEVQDNFSTVFPSSNISSLTSSGTTTPSLLSRPVNHKLLFEALSKQADLTTENPNNGKISLSTFNSNVPSTQSLLSRNIKKSTLDDIIKETKVPDIILKAEDPVIEKILEKMPENKIVLYEQQKGRIPINPIDYTTPQYLRPINTPIKITKLDDLIRTNVYPLSEKQKSSKEKERDARLKKFEIIKPLMIEPQNDFNEMIKLTQSMYKTSEDDKDDKEEIKPFNLTTEEENIKLIETVTKREEEKVLQKKLEPLNENIDYLKKYKPISILNPDKFIESNPISSLLTDSSTPPIEDNPISSLINYPTGNKLLSEYPISTIISKRKELRAEIRKIENLYSEHSITEGRPKPENMSPGLRNLYNYLNELEEELTNIQSSIPKLKSNITEFIRYKDIKDEQSKISKYSDSELQKEYIEANKEYDRIEQIVSQQIIYDEVVDGFVKYKTSLDKLGNYLNGIREIQNNIRKEIELRKIERPIIKTLPTIPIELLKAQDKPSLSDEYKELPAQQETPEFIKFRNKIKKMNKLSLAELLIKNGIKKDDIDFVVNEKGKVEYGSITPTKQFLSETLIDAFRNKKISNNI